ncbi:hypothetical protein [Pelagibacterium limicola]|uniref:hypothetical protein n=1 Tax=Pelagibacterium limicola TaxID=2791022 RepID=UPI0018AFE5DA|nr:hypothetical protein [Pelagibacterium limicola]
MAVVPQTYEVIAMGYKEWTAIVQLLSAVGVIVWLAMDFAAAGFGNTTAELATRLLWAIGALIAINIVGMILANILVAIVRQRTLEDEPTDERDDMIDARSSRIGYAVTSSLAALALIPLAMGFEPSLAIAMLFVAPFAGGVAHAAAQLVYYRVG